MNKEKLVGTIYIASHPSGRSNHWNKERLYTLFTLKPKQRR
tara:strand:- start:1 stop:123 length:123 start_codon:yes stop_codon:yes gene_type:complete